MEWRLCQLHGEATSRIGRIRADLADILTSQTADIKSDKLSFEKQTKTFPRNPTTNRGTPFWDGSEAKNLLREDLKNNAAIKNMNPMALYATRDEYKRFPKDVFRNHLYKEISKQRQDVFWQAKRNDEGRKQREQHAQNDLV
jgi:hypothetical protein